jgi:hypothetical protein
MVPILVPVLAPVVAGLAGAGVALGAEGNALDPEAPAALLVWASAEITKRTATARKTRIDVLFIGSLELLGTCLFRE